MKKIQIEVQLQELYKDSPTKKDIIEYMSKNNFKIVDTSYGESSKEYEEDLIFEKI